MTHVLQRSQQTLLNSRLRLNAEAGSSIDVAPELVARIIKKLKSGATYHDLTQEVLALQAKLLASASK